MRKLILSTIVAAAAMITGVTSAKDVYDVVP